MTSLTSSQRMHLCIPEYTVKVWKRTLDSWKHVNREDKATEGSTAVFLLDKSQNIKCHRRMQFHGWANSPPPSPTQCRTAQPIDYQML